MCWGINGEHNKPKFFPLESLYFSRKKKKMVSILSSVMHNTKNWERMTVIPTNKII